MNANQLQNIGPLKNSLKLMDAPKADPSLCGIMSISDKEFSLIRELVHDRLGIVLSEAKKSLVVGRLQKIIRSMGLTSFKHYYDCLVTDKTGQSLDTLVNRITTNHTFFNRENAHFDYFRSVALPEITAQLKDRKSRDIRIWCAGCSSGEEPYMLAMIMLEFFGTEYGMWNAGVLATDISTRALNKAIAGIYSDNNIEHLPAFARKHFIRSGDDQWRICDKVKKDVTFRRFNLMNASFPFKEPFQVIFCRNVMIYFDRPTRAELVRKFYGHLVSGGHLLIGHSETLGRLQDLYAYVMPAVYRRR